MTSSAFGISLTGLLLSISVMGAARADDAPPGCDFFVAQQIGQQASQMSGVNPQIVMQMMPAVASILMGGLAQGMASQGLGGWLGQLAGAMGAPAAANPAANAAAGPLGNWMNMVGSLMGMGSAAAPAPAV